MLWVTKPGIGSQDAKKAHTLLFYSIIKRIYHIFIPAVILYI